MLVDSAHTNDQGNMSEVWYKACVYRLLQVINELTWLALWSLYMMSPIHSVYIL